MAEARQQTTWKQSCEGSKFHGDKGGIACYCRQDAEADNEVLSGAESRGCGRDSTTPEAVFHEPKFVKACVLGQASKCSQEFRRILAAKHHAKRRLMHSLHLSETMVFDQEIMISYILRLRLRLRLSDSGHGAPGRSTAGSHWSCMLPRCTQFSDYRSAPNVLA